MQQHSIFTSKANSTPCHNRCNCCNFCDFIDLSVEQMLPLTRHSNCGVYVQFAQFWPAANLRNWPFLQLFCSWHPGCNELSGKAARNVKVGWGSSFVALLWGSDETRERAWDDQTHFCTTTFCQSTQNLSNMRLFLVINASLKLTSNIGRSSVCLCIIFGKLYSSSLVWYQWSNFLSILARQTLV